METLLVFGGSGLLGGKVAALARESFQVVATYTRTKPRHPGINFVELPKENVEEGMVLVRKTKPSAVIDAEAMDDVDRCEEERDLAWQVNAGSTGSLARVATDIGARYLFVSSDFVFDGTKGGYREQDVPSRYDFAVRLVKAFGLDPEAVRPVRAAELHLKAPRPANASLSSVKAKRHRIAVLPVDEGIAAMKEQRSLDSFVPPAGFKSGVSG